MSAYEEAELYEAAGGDDGADGVVPDRALVHELQEGAEYRVLGHGLGAEDARGPCLCPGD